jgi:hypothetical protein
MHSRFQIWDFLNSFKVGTLRNFEGVLAINSFDHVCLKIIKDHMLQNLDGQIILYKMAGDVKKEWIEEEFKTLSLFPETESFFIHQANELHADLLDSFSSIHPGQRFVILSFENDQSSWKKVIKEGKIKTITIEAPKFWEMNKLLDFCCNYFKLILHNDTKTWMLEFLENNLPAFYNACFLIKINHPESHEIGISEVKKLLSSEKVDQFAMASLFSKKKKKDFYFKIISVEKDFEKMRNIFLFLQSHLIKLLDPSYLTLKSKLTNYDKEIQATSKLWSQEELTLEISHLNKLEILSKKKDPLLWQELKINYIRTL